jgi:selenocysteine lyase/cysteine desulfurase
LGPQGTGFIYIREGIEIEPIIHGGSGEDDAGLSLSMPERLEAGTLNTPGIAGLGAGIGHVLEKGAGSIRSHELNLVSMLISGLLSLNGIRLIGPRDPEKRAGLVAFNIEGMDPVEAGAALDERFSIILRAGTHCAPDAHRFAGTYPLGALRASPGVFNTEKDIDALINALKALLGA